MSSCELDWEVKVTYQKNKSRRDIYVLELLCPHPRSSFSSPRHPELYQMRGSPFTKKKDGKVRDRSGVVIDLFPGVREALLAVHRDEERFRDTRLAIASRTSHERSCIRYFLGRFVHTIACGGS